MTTERIKALAIAADTAAQNVARAADRFIGAPFAGAPRDIMDLRAAVLAWRAATEAIIVEPDESFSDTEHAAFDGVIKLSPIERRVLAIAHDGTLVTVTGIAKTREWVEACHALLIKGLLCADYHLSNEGAEVARTVGAP